MTPEEVRARLTLTVAEAAEVLGIGRNQAYAAARAGEIPTLKLGHRLLVPVPKLLELVGLPPPSNSEADSSTEPATATIHALHGTRSEIQHDPNTPAAASTRPSQLDRGR